MNKEDLKHNKQCAEALGWEPDLYYYCKGGGVVYVNYLRADIGELHFHDSYDWAMLLVKKCLETRNTANALIWHRESHELEPWLLLTPLQISTACLEVLNG